MQREPPPFIWAAPDEKNILTCTLVFLSLKKLCMCSFLEL